MDGGAAKRIAVLATSGPTRQIIEIGAGTGVLTAALLACEAQVTAVEIDPDLVEILEHRSDLAKARIVRADALEFDFSAWSAGRPWCAAGNLPYNVATPLIVGWLQCPDAPDRIVAMLQRDVADRLAARPSTPAYGSLSLFAQFFSEVKRAFVLGPGSFYPRPKVESAVVVLERRAEPAVAVRDRAFFLQVVRAAFAYRRKTLANSLSLALAIERGRTQRALASLEIDSEIRAEQLDLGAFGALADILAP
jgi:16S rRNA (adenine1518-N6/adenine1519-N6)-dimethyltransferase